ncbi:major facilitator superfamily sugar transporter [Nitzschia inconspicua]|uniref:Hexose transporter 1 n=1 Tax=Nitzschia inconspicua TaxID=303405 RepID=A0A9K3Q779_9STRA|nr:major facilitator superfamily sugar transporter [Nitzschia inconspicua]
MPVSKESLLEGEGHRRTTSSENVVETAPPRQQQPNFHNNDINPIRIQQRRHHEAIHDALPEMQLSHTMKATGTNTLAIYHSAGDRGHPNASHYYTEIPFAAIHGMQTRRRSDGDLYGEVAEPFGTLSLDSYEHRRPVVPSKSFVDELTQSNGAFTWPLVIATMANSMSQFLVGYNIVVLNTTERYIFPGHTTLQWSWAVAALAIGAPMGAMLGGQLSDSIGRKKALIFNAFGFAMTGLLQALAPNLKILTLARFLLGIESGVATVLVPVYLGELAPPKLRGTLGTINQFAFVVGILVADLFSFPLANDSSWRYLLAVTPVIAVLQLFLMPWVVESPVYLLQQTTQEKEATDVLKRLRGFTSTEDAEEEVETYVAVVTALCSPTPRTQHPRNYFDNEDPSTTKRRTLNQGSILWEMVTFPGIRFLFFCSVMLHIGQQLCGVSAVFYYSTSLFHDIIDNPLIGTTSIGAVNVLFTYVALLLMDSCRRKTLVLWSIGGMLFSCTGLILCQVGVIQGSVVPILVFVNSYVAFYAIGFGPIPFLWIAEMVEPRFVTLAMIICSQLNWMTNFLVGLLFPLMMQYLGGFAFAPFGVMLLASFLFVWLVLPEKKESVMLSQSVRRQQRHHFEN